MEIRQTVLPFPCGHADVLIVGGVQLKQFHGTFKSADLQFKADNLLWDVVVLGNGHLGIEHGNGVTPVAAVQDRIARLRDKIGHLQRGVEALERVLPVLKQAACVPVGGQ